MEKIRIGGQEFSKDLFDFFMVSFKESFSHTSLSIESAFEELEDCEAKLIQIKSKYSYDSFMALGLKEKKNIDNYLKRFVVFRGNQFGIIPGKFDVNCPQKEVDSLFAKYFKYMYDDLHYFICFAEDGKFDERETFRRIGDMFQYAYQKHAAHETAYNMQKDHMDAFDYAMSLKKIGILDIIAINEKVNHTRPEKEVGFKVMNNTIVGSNFEVADKKTIPVEMQKLLADYEKDFGLEILDYKDPTISYKERYRRLFKIFEKEAIFHIRFERIHPFSDGNGRTGRIIMNKHLIDQGFAPVLFTDFMTDEYRRCIENYDYERLATIMSESSTQLLSSWVSMRKMGIRPRVSESRNAKLAVIPGESPVKEKKYKSFMF